MIVFSLMLISCRQSEKKNETQKTNVQKNLLIDYKSESYKIHLGDNYKLSDKNIGWKWDAESDENGVLDSTGKDEFMHLGEPLIKYNNGEWLPAMFIATDENNITSFTCSVLFFLHETPSAKADFLKIMAKDIKQLQNEEPAKSLINKGVYKISKQDYSEVFTLTENKGNGYDKFEYTVKLTKP